MGASPTRLAPTVAGLLAVLDRHGEAGAAVPRATGGGAVQRRSGGVRRTGRAFARAADESVSAFLVARRNWIRATYDWSRAAARYA